MQEEDYSTIRNISKEIKRECFRNNIAVSEDFIRFMVELMYLNPEHGITANVTSNRDTVVAFVKMVVDQLKQESSPSIITLKMQWHYADLMKPRNEVVHKEREQIFTLSQTLRELILMRNELNGKEEAVAFKKKIICYASLRMGLGNPMDEAVFNEGLYALRSIMDRYEIEDFAKLPLPEKEVQLDCIVLLLGGIRLFNRDMKKGGEGIPDLPEILAKSRYSIKEQVNEMLQELEGKIQMLTCILDHCFRFDLTETGRTCMRMRPDGILTETDIEYLRDLAVAYRQYDVYMKSIFETLQAAKIKEYMRLYRVTLEELLDICFDRVAVSSVKVFPLFEKQSRTWMMLQDEGLFFIHCSNIVKTLTQCISMAYYPEDKIQKYYKQCYLHVISDEGRRNKIIKDLYVPQTISPFMFRFIPTTTLNPLMFIHGMGYDLFKFAHGEGVLIPGSWKTGLAISMNRLRSLFSESRSVYAFLEALEENTLQFVVQMRRKPMFINLFKLKYLLEGLVSEPIFIEQIVKQTSGASVDCQTDFESEPFIDKDYMWNIWDHKRRAIQLANLSNCETKSTQTDNISGSVGNQTVFKEDKQLDVKKDDYVNTHKPSRFIYGLRGRKDDKQFDIELTRPKED